VKRFAHLELTHPRECDLSEWKDGDVGG